MLESFLHLWANLDLEVDRAGFQGLHVDYSLHPAEQGTYPSINTLNVQLGTHFIYVEPRALHNLPWTRWTRARRPSLDTPHTIPMGPAIAPQNAFWLL